MQWTHGSATRMAGCAALAIAVLAIGSAWEAAVAAPASPARYIGPVSGNAERDTYGSIVGTAPAQTLCISGPAHYFGPRTGDPEDDSYGYDTMLIEDGACPSAVAQAGGN